MFAQVALAWLLTYLLHSTLLLGLAWLASKPLARWSVAAEETMWKLALTGALLTASLQLAAGWEPAAGRWRLAEGTPAVSVPAAVTARTATTPRIGRIQTAAPFAATATSDAAAPSRPEPSSSSSLPTLFLGLWALGAILLIGAYARSFSRIRQRLRLRPRVVGGSLLTQLRELATGAGLGKSVRLSCSSRVPVPVALGIRQPEICLPPRALAGLTEEQQQGLLAHELAHLVRRDPLWLVVSHLLTAVLFFQPLNWVARRRLREISEILSDEWAVTFTGRPLSLAGCLAEVAGWSVGLRPLPLPGMADRPSNLARRIRRLLDETRAPEHPARRLWLAAGMVAVLVAVAAAAPAVSASRQEMSKPPAEKAAAAPETAVQASDSSWLDARPEHDKSPRAESHEEQAKMLAEVREDAEEVSDVPDIDVDESSIDGAMAAADAALEKVSASMDEPLDSLHERLVSARDAGLSAEQQRKLEREIERTTRDIQKRLQPRLEQLSREMGRNMARMKTLDPEMGRLARDMAKLATQMRPSKEALERLSAGAQKLAAEGALSREEREKLRADAYRLAESMKPTAEQRREMEALRDEMRKHHGEMSHEVMAEHREEIEKARAEMRDEIEREMRGVREELHRALQERYQVDREARREHRKEAVQEKMKEKKSKIRQQYKQKQDKQKEKTKEKELREDSDGSR